MKTSIIEMEVKDVKIIMNIIDEYWFFVMKAISEPLDSDKLYYYDKDYDVMFSIQNNEYGVNPVFRNLITERNYDNLKLFSSEMHRVKEHDKSIFVLPRLSIAERKSFLTMFTNMIKNEQIKSKLLGEIDELTIKDNLSFKTDLKSIDKHLFLEFDYMQGKFLANCVKEKYTILGISEETKVLW